MTFIGYKLIQASVYCHEGNNVYVGELEMMFMKDLAECSVDRFSVSGGVILER